MKAVLTLYLNQTFSVTSVRKYGSPLVPLFWDNILNATYMTATMTATIISLRFHVSVYPSKKLSCMWRSPDNYVAAATSSGGRHIIWRPPVFFFQKMWHQWASVHPFLDKCDISYLVEFVTL